MVFLQTGILYGSGQILRENSISIQVLSPRPDYRNYGEGEYYCVFIFSRKNRLFFFLNHIKIGGAKTNRNGFYYSHKIRMMTSQLQETFKGMISDSMWTDAETEKVTTFKIDAIKVRVGFPELFKMPEVVDKSLVHVRLL